MNPLSAIFGAGVYLRNTLYDRGIFRARRLQSPVISVGNLSVGGSGKTPLVIALGEQLKQRGIAFDVLSRGYGRVTGGIAQVNTQGSPREFGDEPLLIARRLQVPVFVGSDRYEAGVLAERSFAPALHLLDDGFQHRRLARDLDIVLVSSEDFKGSLLPTGRLRETPSALARSKAVVLTDYGPENSGSDLANAVRQFSSAQIWRVRPRISLLNTPPRAVAFSGIARPSRFFLQLPFAGGVPPAATIAFRDHHRYTEADIDRLLKIQKETGAGGFITTEKDEINLQSLAGALQPLAIVSLSLEFCDAQSAVAAMLAQLPVRS